MVDFVDEGVLGVTEDQQERGDELKPDVEACSSSLGGELVFLGHGRGDGAGGGRLDGRHFEENAWTDRSRRV